MSLFRVRPPSKMHTPTCIQNRIESIDKHDWISRSAPRGEASAEGLVESSCPYPPELAFGAFNRSRRGENGDVHVHAAGHVPAFVDLSAALGLNVAAPQATSGWMRKGATRSGWKSKQEGMGPGMSWRA